MAIPFETYRQRTSRKKHLHFMTCRRIHLRSCAEKFQTEAQQRAFSWQRR